MSELTPQFVEKYATAHQDEKLGLCTGLTGGQKMTLGVLLFERECEIIKREIRRQMPDASDQFVMAVLRMAIRMVHRPKRLVDRTYAYGDQENDVTHRTDRDSLG